MIHRKMIARLMGFFPNGSYLVYLHGRYFCALKGRVKKPVRESDTFIWVYRDLKTGYLVRCSDPK